MLELSLPNIVFENTQPEEVIAAGPKCKLLLKTQDSSWQLEELPSFSKEDAVSKGWYLSVGSEYVHFIYF